MGGEMKGARPNSPPPVLEERVKKALRRAGRPLSLSELRCRSGVRIRRGLSEALRSALANLLEGSEVHAFEGTMPGSWVRRRRVVLYELRPRA
jgi:hypothetical protein